MFFGELHEELRIESHRAVVSDVELHHPTLQAIGVELIVPSAVERVGKIYALSVAADFDHLRSAVERLRGVAWVRRAFGDAADANRTDELRIEWVANVVLSHFSGAPTRCIKVLVVERQVDVAKQRGNRTEALKHVGQLIGIGR